MSTKTASPWVKLFCFLGLVLVIGALGKRGYTVAAWILGLALLVFLFALAKSPVSNFFSTLGG